MKTWPKNIHSIKNGSLSMLFWWVPYKLRIWVCTYFLLLQNCILFCYHYFCFKKLRGFGQKACWDSLVQCQANAQVLPIVQLRLQFIETNTATKLKTFWCLLYNGVFKLGFQHWIANKKCFSFICNSNYASTQAFLLTPSGPVHLAVKSSVWPCETIDAICPFVLFKLD